MTKISNQYSLTNILTADLANSRLGINNVSPTVALDVTGTARVSGAINLGSSAVFPTVGLFNRTSDTTLYMVTATSGFALLDNSQNSMYIATPTSHIWNISNSEKMRINSTGNVGIGTTTIPSKLTVDTGLVTGAGQWASTAIAIYNPTNIGAYSQISFGYTPSTTNAAAYIGFISTNQNSNGFGDLVFGTRSVSTDTQPTERMRITSGGDLSLTSGVAILNRSGKKIELNPNSALTNTTAEIEITSGMDLFFKLGGSERMRITSGGDLILGIGAAATNVNFDINGIVNKAGRIRFQESGSSKWLMGNGAASENGRFEIYDNVNGTGVQLLRNATSWTALSDERFKDIIEPIENVIIKFKNIRTVIGKYKTDNEAVRRNFLIAQDLLKVFPEVVDVDENEEKPMGIRYQDLIPVLVKAIQELSAKVSLLENK